MSAPNRSDDRVILRSGDPRHDRLYAAGWRVVARSWAAQLDVCGCDRGVLGRMVLSAGPARFRELAHHDVPAVLRLDAATAGDYPGDVATAHTPLTPAAAATNERRRGFGAFDPTGALLAVTYVDLEGNRGEIDFTVVARHARRRGLATALKAASVLVLGDDGITHLRTGGSADNATILAANRALGFVLDEEWVTLAPALSGGRWAGKS